MCALGKELQRRGHDVTLFGTPDVEPVVAASIFRFRTFSAHGVRTAPLDDVNERLGRMNGLAALRCTIEWMQEQAVAFLQAGPDTLTASGVEALLVDQVSVAGGTVADALGLPFITICNALPINREADIPPFFTSWRFGTSPSARLRNRIGWHLFDRLTSPLREVVAAKRREWKLPAHVGREGFLSSLAQISQLPMELDFPRRFLPACFHYTGPLRVSIRHRAALPPGLRLSVRGTRREAARLCVVGDSAKSPTGYFPVHRRGVRWLRRAARDLPRQARRS